MGDPTSAQVETFTTIGDIATFVEITGTDADRTTVLGSLLTHMGYQAKDRPATLGVITEADADALADCSGLRFYYWGHHLKTCAIIGRIGQSKANGKDLQTDDWGEHRA